MRRGVVAGVVGAFVLVAGGVGYAGFNVWNGLAGDTVSTAGGHPAPKRTGPPDAKEIQQASRAFFAAWEKGDATGAASYTNNASAAEQALTGFNDDAHISGVTVTPRAATGATVPYAVRATVSYQGKSKPLAYDTQLTVVRGLTTGRALVDWTPAVLHPQLKTGDTLVTDASGAPPIEAVDRDGAVLTKEKYPSLGPILDELRAKYGEKAGGTPALELVVRHQSETAPDTVLATLAKGRPGTLHTTLSAAAQAAAEHAVTQFAESSVVAVKPSTGEVLAVANHRKDSFNAAFQGELAPGSTMKIITSATLIDNGITTASGPAPCPDTATWQSQTFHNEKGLTPDLHATLASSFARSCNTAFLKYADEVKVDSLTKEAQDHFGLGRDNWKTGIPSFDGSVPASGGPNTAANMIGQGQVQMDPLNMASVTATAMTGVFRQPVIVPQSLDGRTLATAQGLSSGTVAQLRQMMHRTAISGTAAAAMSGLGGDIGAKTGSAEVDAQAKSNSWFAGYRGDIAAAAMTQSGGHGADAAGPIVAGVLRAVG
ncbi:penicillin-binding transpeptidase domain-containing protein [Streptomyces sp. TS71-3]|uniref:penicillin-binding transpeptidase domain-containing protein n=1 Tax=Streptomyces sp. TS71-3 TaxID=2733862 RepID=UPI001B1FA20F|nr:penicillin-binding transpeptidase domain-containing protein [Streptomyces sp. TS71-3]GHJ39662.1 penicillin-binding protein [Streptomyces sp. TS71-3]